MSLIETTDRIDARIAGFQAGRSGECYRHCPHPYLSDFRTAWLEGWRLGREARKALAAQAKHDFRSAVAS